MADSRSRYLHELLSNAQNKYGYFLLAAAASAIALAVNQTEAAPLAWSQIPLAAAVLCWGSSFMFGCRHLASFQAGIRANAVYLGIQEGTFSEFPIPPGGEGIALEESHKATLTHAEAAGRNANRQFRFLIAGAVFYVAWHVLEMALRTPSAE